MEIYLTSIREHHIGLVFFSLWPPPWLALSISQIFRNHSHFGIVHNQTFRMIIFKIYFE